MARISYSRRGKTWNFVDSTGSVELSESGIEGLVGDLREETVMTPGAPGQQVTSQDVVPMEGRLRAHVEGDEARSAGDIWAELRAAFVRGRHEEPGVLTVETRWGVLHAHVYLAGPIEVSSVDPDDELLLEIDVPLISDEGYWWSEPEQMATSGAVANRGDIMLYPHIKWSGAGGRVQMPSGWDFTLPAVSGVRVLLLDPLENLAVVDEVGVPDYAAMDALELIALGEGVPPGQSRIFVLPDGAALEFSQRYLDPWKKR